MADTVSISNVKMEASLWLINELEKGRVSGETVGWYSPEDVAEYLRTLKNERQKADGS